MGKYINNTSLGFILVFILMIAFSLSLFRVVNYFDRGDAEPTLNQAIKAESTGDR